MREELLLKLLCVVVAAGFFVLIAYNFLAGGSIISTDGLFFTVVPMVLALSFLMVPLMSALTTRLQRRALAAGAAGGSQPKLAPAGGGVAWVPGARTVPALTDARGRALPPDVNRMMADMKAPRPKESQ